MTSPNSYAPFLVMLTSLLAFPMMYMVNSAQAVHGEFGLFVSASACPAIVIALTYAAIRMQKSTGHTDWLLYGISRLPKTLTIIILSIRLSN